MKERKKKKQKPTLKERIIAAKRKHDAAVEAAAKAAEAADEAALDFIYGDAEDMAALHESGHSFQEVLKMLKGMKAWPRIVLGIYDGEREAAEQRKKENPPLKGSAEDVEPSDKAYEEIGRLIGVGEHRVKALCAEARRDIDAGAPRKPKMSAAEFENYWCSRR